MDDPQKERDRMDRLAQVQHKLEAAIAKNRNGPTHTVELFFDAGCNVLDNYSRWA
jgi:replicative DNA helicase